MKVLRPVAQIKVDEEFRRWLCLPETKSFIDTLFVSITTSASHEQRSHQNPQLQQGRDAVQLASSNLATATTTLVKKPSAAGKPVTDKGEAAVSTKTRVMGRPSPLECASPRDNSVVEFTVPSSPSGVKITPQSQHSASSVAAVAIVENLRTNRITHGRYRPHSLPVLQSQTPPAESPSLLGVSKNSDGGRDYGSPPNQDPSHQKHNDNNSSIPPNPNHPGNGTPTGTQSERRSKNFSVNPGSLRQQRPTSLSEPSAEVSIAHAESQLRASTKLPRVICSIVAHWLSRTPRHTHGGVMQQMSSSPQGSNASGRKVVELGDLKKFHVRYLRNKGIDDMLWCVLRICTTSPGVYATGASTSPATARASVPNTLVPANLRVLVQSIAQSHPGLQALREAPEFMSYYCDHVIVRLFRQTGRSHQGVLGRRDILQKCNLLKVLLHISSSEDLYGTVFAYQDFCVVYYKFWELDHDHDHVLRSSDIHNYNDYRCVTRFVADRCTSIHPIPLNLQGSRPPVQNSHTSSTEVQWRGTSGESVGGATFMDWVWFIMSEEDKGDAASAWYWFSVLDLDSDGILSGYEMEQFYKHISQGLLNLGEEPIDWTDVYRELLDMVGAKGTTVTLNRIINSSMARQFFTTLTNPAKLAELEESEQLRWARPGRAPNAAASPPPALSESAVAMNAAGKSSALGMETMTNLNDDHMAEVSDSRSEWDCFVCTEYQKYEEEELAA
ncbi:Serine/threonine-protein phosphatase 2A regulatory subunit B'' subunit beta [Pelomyxa schiedti]|nr:Serine/threonine-protein phosphatase 2A regulatory subunit B'' subunit beta [Pelomyxa schiedti]